MQRVIMPSIEGLADLSRKAEALKASFAAGEVADAHLSESWDSILSDLQSLHKAFQDSRSSLLKKIAEAQK